MGRTWSKRKRSYRKLAPKEKFDDQEFVTTRFGAEKDLLSLQRSAGNRATNKALSESRQEVEPVKEDPTPISVDPGTILSMLPSGQPVPKEQKEELSSQLGSEVDQIQVHDDPVADKIARSLGAQALSIGKHILLRQESYQPQTTLGKDLLAHEARHIAAGTKPGGTASAQPVQLAALSPDDVTEEMVGQSFILRSEQGSPPNQIPKGASVIIKDWKGTSGTASVEYRPAGKGVLTLDIPKLALEPDIHPVAGLRVYRTGVRGQQKAVEKAEGAVGTKKEDIEDWRKQEGSYKKKPEKWKEQLNDLEAELARRESVLADKEKVLSRMLLVETMYNRFDPLIVKWVEYYNQQLHPKIPCDPNIVKSMMFRESRIGTSGKELSPGPSTDWSNINVPFHARFNIMMNIASSGEQQMIMLRELAPDIFTKHHLNEFEKKQKPKEWNDTVIWGNPEFRAAVQEMFQRRDASGHNALGTRNTDLQLDYEFWIRTGIRWLFFKYISLPADKRTWEEAARAYNGSGPDARQYRKDVMSRVGGTKELDVGMK
jgi:hypothetical protein